MNICSHLVPAFLAFAFILTGCIQEPEEMAPLIDDYGDSRELADGNDSRPNSDASAESQEAIVTSPRLLGVAEPDIHGLWFSACDSEGTCEAAAYVFNGPTRMLFAIGRQNDAEDYYMRFSDADLGVIEGPFSWVIEDNSGQQFRSNSYDTSRYAANYGEPRNSGFIGALERGEAVRFALIRGNRRFIFEIPAEGFSDALDAISSQADR